MTSTNFETRTQLILDFCQADKIRNQFLELSKEAANHLDNIVKNTVIASASSSSSSSSSNADQKSRKSSPSSSSSAATAAAAGGTPSRLASADTLTFTSPTSASEENIPASTTTSSNNNSNIKYTHSEMEKQRSKELRRKLRGQRKALKHELETLAHQQHIKKTTVLQRCVEISRLRRLTETVLPRAQEATSSQDSQFREALSGCHDAVKKSLQAATQRELELRKKLFSSPAYLSKKEQEKLHHHHHHPRHGKTAEKSAATRLQILRGMLSKLEEENHKKRELVVAFEKRVGENEASEKAETESKAELELLQVEFAALRDRERFLRHTLAVDAVRRVLESHSNSNKKPFQLRSRNAHARMSEAMAFLKAEVIHFGHDVRPVGKALSHKAPEALFKQAHNELKLIVGLMLDSQQAASFQRKQNQAWPLTHEMLVDKFPPHKTSLAYEKLSEMVVAWDCLTKTSQEQLTTAQEVAVNAETILMLARHVGDLYSAKRNQMSDRAAKIAAQSTGDSSHVLHQSHHLHHHHHTNTGSDNVSVADSTNSGRSHSHSHHRRTNSGGGGGVNFSSLSNIPHYYSPSSSSTTAAAASSMNLPSSPTVRTTTPANLPTSPSSRKNVFVTSPTTTNNTATASSQQPQQQQQHQSSARRRR